MSLRSKIYGVILFFITLTGFAQMPIFKRYYIADIPGLGWLARFFVTHSLHYLFASLLIGLCAYAIVSHLLDKKGKNRRITRVGYVKIISLAGLVATGGVMVVKNLPGVFLPHNAIIALDILHIILCMVLIGASVWALVFRKGWTT